MELMTQEIAAKLREANAARVKADASLLPYDEQAALAAPIVVKYFDPCGASTWYILDGEENVAVDDDGQERLTGDWMLFGLCDLGMGPHCTELGYVLLSELREQRVRFGLGIERDLYYDGKTLADARRDAGLEVSRA